MEAPRHFRGASSRLYKAGDSILIKPKSVWLLSGHPTARRFQGAPELLPVYFSGTRGSQLSFIRVPRPRH